MTELFANRNQIIASADAQLAAADAANQAAEDLLAGIDLDAEAPASPGAKKKRINRNLQTPSSSGFIGGSGDEDGGSPRPQKNKQDAGSTRGNVRDPNAKLNTKSGIRRY